MKKSVIGFPRIGEKRELKKAIENYLKNNITQKELLEEAKNLRGKQWKLQEEKGIDYISSNDFSFYDNMLDTAVLLNVIPKRFTKLPLNELDKYFAMARGYQKNGYEEKALEMKKWFNTNYHYVVPELTDSTKIKLTGTKPFDEYKEALELNIKTKPVIIGPLTFLKLAKIQSGKSYEDYIDDAINAYSEIFNNFNSLNAEWLQIDEPILVTDLSREDKLNFIKIYKKLFASKGSLKLLLQTYFGDIRDIYEIVLNMEFDGVGLDFVEGKLSLEFFEEDFSITNKKIFAGIINGKNIWKNNYQKSLQILETLKRKVNKDDIVINTSCSLLHCPYTLRNEIKLDDKYKKQLAFAEEKLVEINELALLFQENDYTKCDEYINNQQVKKERESNKDIFSEDLNRKIRKLNKKDFLRQPPFEKRIEKQRELLNLPILPTTTIGSFPQTTDIRKLRKEFNNGLIDESKYVQTIKEKIKETVKLQEKIDIDVLVHGEYERNDMVEYFGENLKGFIFTENGWVQSYGTRGVKPPIIFGDVIREKPITVEWIKFAQSLTKKPLKGMLTGPITILNWSFPREDISLKEMAFQIALAIKDEVHDLEKAGINIIQIDEAALREKLPLRKEDWRSEYLDWAIDAFRLVNSKVKNTTQIHTHMCYSEFKDIIEDISKMDADVITIESAKSDFTMLDTLADYGYKNDVGPGVYDIHSPRVPPISEFTSVIQTLLDKLDTKRVWINPDCGLKTRNESEVEKSLVNMVEAAKEIRKTII